MLLIKKSYNAKLTKIELIDLILNQNKFMNRLTKSRKAKSDLSHKIKKANKLKVIKIQAMAGMTRRGIINIMTDCTILKQG